MKTNTKYIFSIESIIKNWPIFAEVIVDELTASLKQNSILRQTLDTAGKDKKDLKKIFTIKKTYDFSVELLQQCYPDIDANFSRVYDLLHTSELSSFYRIVNEQSGTPNPNIVRYTEYSKDVLHEVLDKIGTKNAVLILGKNWIDYLNKNQHSFEKYYPTCTYEKVISESRNGSNGTYYGFNIWIDHYSNCNCFPNRLECFSYDSPFSYESNLVYSDQSLQYNLDVYCDQGNLAKLNDPYFVNALNVPTTGIYED